LAVGPYRRYSAEEKALLLAAVESAQERSGQSIEAILERLGLERARYFRWRKRQATGRLADEAPGGRQASPPTPAEVEAVECFTLTQPTLGYKRLAWLMVDQDIAYLSPYWVGQVLKRAGLLRTRTPPAGAALSRPPAPERPDEQWHIDIMYVRVAGRWFYLVDIIDAYSRYLVDWSLNPTLLAETVTNTVQQALESLPERRPGEPKTVHDHGGQFLSAEWRSLIGGAHLTDIVTRVAHPESNGVVERLHRTHREEAFDVEPGDYHEALAIMTRHATFYNHRRPHSALGYLCPVDYYRGDPEARQAERRQKLADAAERRRLFWAGEGS
jgi:transposase InsO family protein/transposase-like protein